MCGFQSNSVEMNPLDIFIFFSNNQGYWALV